MRWLTSTEKRYHDRSSACSRPLSFCLDLKFSTEFRFFLRAQLEAVYPQFLQLSNQPLSVSCFYSAFPINVSETLFTILCASPSSPSLPNEYVEPFKHGGKLRKCFHERSIFMYTQSCYTICSIRCMLLSALSVSAAPANFRLGEAHFGEEIQTLTGFVFTRRCWWALAALTKWLQPVTLMLIIASVIACNLANEAVGRKVCFTDLRKLINRMNVFVPVIKVYPKKIPRPMFAVKC